MKSWASAYGSIGAYSGPFSFTEIYRGLGSRVSKALEVEAFGLESKGEE